MQARSRRSTRVLMNSYWEALASGRLECAVRRTDELAPGDAVDWKYQRRALPSSLSIPRFFLDLAVRSSTHSSCADAAKALAGPRGGPAISGLPAAAAHGTQLPRRTARSSAWRPPPASGARGPDLLCRAARGPRAGRVVAPTPLVGCCCCCSPRREELRRRAAGGCAITPRGLGTGKHVAGRRCSCKLEGELPPQASSHSAT
jgi:hypothetical protein